MFSHAFLLLSAFKFSVHLIFVNEGGYYFEQSGTGIGVAVKAGYDLRTGLFLKEGDERLESYQSFGEL